MPNPFDQNNEGATQFADRTPEEFFEEFVGEGKRYTTPAEAVRALAHAQHHISTLEQEAQELRKTTEKSRTVEDIMKALKEAQGDNPTNTDEADLPDKSKDESGVDIEELVSKKLSEHEKTKIAQSNKSQVTAALKEHYGDKAGEIWDKAESAFHVDLDSLAASSPDAVYQLLGLKAEHSPSKSGSSFSGDKRRTPDHGVRPPEGSKRLLDYQLEKGEIDKGTHTKLRYQYSSDPDKYRA